MSRLQVRCTSHHNSYLFLAPPEAKHPDGEQCHEGSCHPELSHWVACYQCKAWLKSSVYMRQGTRYISGHPRAGCCYEILRSQNKIQAILGTIMRVVYMHIYWIKNSIFFKQKDHTQKKKNSIVSGLYEKSVDKVLFEYCSCNKLNKPQITGSGQDFMW